MITAEEFAKAAIRRMCTWCRRGFTPDRGKWGWWNHSGVKCPACDIHEMLHEANNAIPAGTCGRLEFVDDPTGREWFRVVVTACKVKEEVKKNTQLSED